MNKSSMFEGCPNMDVVEERGRYVCRCRAQNNAVLNENVVMTVCVDSNASTYWGTAHSAYMHFKRPARDQDKPASYDSCRYNRGIYR